MIRILYIGDIFGKPGRRTVKELLPGLKEEFALDLVIEIGRASCRGRV